MLKKKFFVSMLLCFIVLLSAVVVIAADYSEDIASVQDNEVLDAVSKMEQNLIASIQGDEVAAAVSRAELHIAESYNELKRLGIRVNLGDLGNIAQMLTDPAVAYFNGPSFEAYSPDAPRLRKNKIYQLKNIHRKPTKSLQKPLK